MFQLYKIVPVAFETDKSILPFEFPQIASIAVDDRLILHGINGVHDNVMIAVSIHPFTSVTVKK